MGCKYMDQCPCVDEWCKVSMGNYGRCTPIFIMICKNLEEELQKYKDTGLSPDQIREIDRLYAEQAKELASYKSTGLTPDQVREQTKILRITRAIWD